MFSSEESKYVNSLLLEYPVEERPIILQMMQDRITGNKTSKRDYKKMIKIQKKLRLQRIKNENR